MTYSKPSEFLEALGNSHGIFLAEMLDECEFETNMVPTSTGLSQKKAIEARGLGGYVTEEFDEGRTYFTGWGAAAALARFYLGREPGAMKMGRGSAFRMNYQALKEAGH